MIAYLSEQNEKRMQSAALVAYRGVVEEKRCNQIKQEQKAIRASYRCSPTWLRSLAKRWETPHKWQCPSLGLRSTKTLFQLRQILVRMSRVCWSFHKAASTSI